MKLLTAIGMGLGIVIAVIASFALVMRLVDRLAPPRAARFVLPLAMVALALVEWHLAIVWTHSTIFPKPTESIAAIAELATTQRLWKDVAASLFRVTWGFTLAAAIGIPLGLWIGWSARAYNALNPLIQGLRPISPIAWIPIAILWFGIGDVSGIFLILYASFFPIVVGTTAAVLNISQVHVRSAQNFGLRGLELFRRLVLPASMPQIITSLRIALGVAWLVIVAAEMVGMQSGLGYLINDARNMGKRYDLVVAGMMVIGAIGIVLDVLIRRLERFDEVRWGFAKR